MTGKIYTLGYAQPDAQQCLAALMDSEQTLLVDIRYKPYSRRPEWQGEALRAKWGKRYRPVWELGNRNYNNDKPIELAASYTGWKIVKPWLEAGHDLILLCTCARYEQCHRSTVVEYIREQMPDIEIEDEDMKPFNVWRPMKGFLPALSIQQPFAWLIAHQAEYPNGKDIENRDWKTSYRGPLLIHAGKKVDPACFDANDLHTPGVYRAGADLQIRERIPLRKSDYETGGIIGICDLVDIVEQSDSPWFCGRYGFVLANARPLPFVAYKGAIGLFPVIDTVLLARGVDETTLRARNIPDVPPPDLDNAYDLTQAIAKAEAAKAKPKVPVDYWTSDKMDFNAKERVRSALKAKY